MITKSSSPVLLSIANDIISSDMVVPQQIGALGVNAEPYVLDQSPDVLSIERRCVQGGYSLQWLPYSLVPTLTCPTGKVVKLVSRDCCPYLDDYEPNERSVAASANVVRPRHNADQRSDVATCEGRGSTDKGCDDSDSWTAVGTTTPTRVPLHPQGCENLIGVLWRVEMVKSARRAVAGDGVCIGLTYTCHEFLLL